jgi:hypothetical protein
MLGDPPKPKPKGQTCSREKCRAWYRPSKYRSAGRLMEFCSLRCMKKAQAEALLKKETGR